ncbi:NitT/TauT family transport system permease protein [Clostridium moniliforme]|uniref:NitT/TauT family transport system permease protein n=1 Tax=Clostridium moniliforme TaxID=39489 RepID=A0ABS4EXV5_9CLOT|nr:ABC transporter permease subunit [Clostridium moniliforme]MBP1888836.1 NitT/TauT family transport system permease protein [Clostridium moniliforme]
MKESTWKSKFEILIGGFILLLLWQVIALKINNDIYLPKLQEVLTSLFQIVKEKDFLLIVFSSFYRTIISFGVALVFAIIMGVLSSLYPLINNLLKPLNSIGKTIPTLVLVVLALIWVDKDNAPFIVGIAIVFPILYDGILNTLTKNDKKLEEMMKIYEVPTLEKVKKVYVPNIIFYILKILVPTISLAFKVVIAGEVHGQPKYGIGASVQLAKMNFDTPTIFAWIVIIAIISLLFELVNKILTKKYYRWQKDE